MGSRDCAACLCIAWILWLDSSGYTGLGAPVNPTLRREDAFDSKAECTEAMQKKVQSEHELWIGDSDQLKLRSGSARWHSGTVLVTRWLCWPAGDRPQLKIPYEELVEAQQRKK
jgi:hypothetical protein